MPLEEILARLKSIWIWSPKNSMVRQMTADIIQKLGGVIPQEYNEPQ